MYAGTVIFLIIGLGPTVVGLMDRHLGLTILGLMYLVTAGSFEVYSRWHFRKETNSGR